MDVLAGEILTDTGWVKGKLHFDRKVIEINPCESGSFDCYIVPGLVDLHVHGGGGFDVMDGEESIRQLARWHGGSGTTSLLATTVSAPWDKLRQIVQDVARVNQEDNPLGARVLGAHLEGPFINPKKQGALPVVEAPSSDSSLWHDICEQGPLKVVTLAIESVDGDALIGELCSLGVRVQMGHSACSYEQAVQGIKQGAKGFTHLFNAMSGLHHREPGLVGAALAHGEFAEIIPDLLHVHKGAILAALRAIPKLYCVTDAMSGAGMPDGEYSLGGHTVNKCQNGVRMADGTIAGSTLTTIQALRNLVEIGLSLEEAVKRCSTFPAEYLGLFDRGRLAPGCHSDILVLDKNLGLMQVFVEGVSIDLTNDEGVS